MDFSYYKKGKLVNLNINIGTKWDDLNIENSQLNSIFSKIDDGDKVISEKELNLLEKLLHKADTILHKADNILENQELNAFMKQIDEKKIIIPNNYTKDIEAAGYIEIQYKISQYKEMQKDLDLFNKKEIEKIRTKLSEKYPADNYNIEVYPKGRGFEFNIHKLDNKILAEMPLSQTSTIIRDDGIEITISDSLNNEILNDEKADYSKEHQSANYGTITITDENGKKHDLNFNLEYLYDNDVLDCRRASKNISQFLANLPNETIKQIIESGAEEIYFSNEYDDPLLSDSDYFRKKADKNGNVIDICSDAITIISPTFTVPKREYKDLSFMRNDGYKIDLESSYDSSGTLKISSNTNKEAKINIQGVRDYDHFQQWQLPKLKNMLNELSKDVINDLSNEISDIIFMDNSNENGIYVINSNAIAFKTDAESETPTISFVHELGHAIDNKNGTMYSNSSEFKDKFDKFKKLIEENGFNNHALDNPEEFFASTYADLNYPDKSSNNHIAEMEKQLSLYKNSNNKQQQESYNLFLELKQDVKNYVETLRNSSKAERSDDRIKNLVKENCQDVISQLNKFNLSFIKSYLSGQSIELDIINIVSLKDDDFQKGLEFYKLICQNKLTNFMGDHIEIPEEIQELFGKLFIKIQDIRKQISSLN